MVLDVYAISTSHTNMKWALGTLGTLLQHIPHGLHICYGSRCPTNGSEEEG